MLLFEGIDVTPITSVITDVSTKGLTVVAAAIAAGFALWGVTFLARKARRSIG